MTTTSLMLDDDPLLVRDVAGLWIWHAGLPIVDDPSATVRQYVQREWHLAMSALAASIPTERCINHPARARWLDGNKVEQLRIAEHVGFSTPETIVSNDVDAIVDFAARFPCVAVKSQGGLVFSEDDAPLASYTQRCTSIELAQHALALERAPVLVQRYVEKSDELRITCIDDDVYACSIDSQASERTSIDWRRYDFDAVAHEPIPVPLHLASKLRRFLSISGLRYGAFDFIRTLDGDLVFLEVNPSGQFAWIEHLTGAPIAHALARALVHGAPPPQ